MKQYMLERADVNWETNDREMKKFMYHWCNGDDHETIAAELNRTCTEVILLMLHLESINILVERPNGMFGFEGHRDREQITEKLFKKWNLAASRIITDEMRHRMECEEMEHIQLA